MFIATWLTLCLLANTIGRISAGMRICASASMSLVVIANLPPWVSGTGSAACATAPPARKTAARAMLRIGEKQVVIKSFMDKKQVVK